MLRHINKHIKRPAGNINDYLCNFCVEKSLSMHEIRGETTKEKVDGFYQLKMQNTYTVKNKPN